MAGFRNENGLSRVWGAVNRTVNGGLTPEQAAWRWRILSSTFMGYAGYYLTRKLFTICKTSIAADLKWELGDTAHIMAAFLFAYMLGQFINGYLGRKWGPRVILLGGLGLSIACNIVFGIANSFPTFLVFMFVNGLVQATGWPGCVGGVSQWLRSTERGTIMGWWSTNYIFGNMLCKSIGGWLLGSMGWRWSFFGCTALTVGIWWLLYFWQRDRPEDVGLDPIVDPESAELRAIDARQEQHATFNDYLRLLVNPLVLIMGCSYFCCKFMRYALDSWLPAFLNLQGLGVASASYYSTIFDGAGIVGTIFAGFVLDRYFRRNWAVLCFLMAVGAIGGYVAVIYAGANPRLVAVCYGIVGFMLYGPDTLLGGAAAIAVAGEANGVAVAGIVNGIGSIGPIVQEEVIGFLMHGDVHAGIRNANLLTLGMSILFALLMIVVAWRLHVAHAQQAAKNAK
ncbi:MAG: MFS transporter [Candidatus Hydrogenedentes bacterium]|nr:MFS transporter [Candidatus Hydrogenedentota bacterium]